MINKISKKINKNKACPTKSSRRGFALLFSVLIASLLLSIGLSIFNITLKELAISTAIRHSVSAFYAADSGREQAIYNDLKLGKYIFDVDDPIITTDYNDDYPLSIFIRLDADNDGPNFRFKVIKSLETISTTTKIKTSVVSTGHNIKYGDRIEREIKQSY